MTDCHSDCNFALWPGHITFVEIGHEIYVISTAILSLPLIQVGQLSVTDESQLLAEDSDLSTGLPLRKFKPSQEMCEINIASVFRENRCPPPPKPVYGGNFSHEVVTLKIRSRSPKSIKLLILSILYRLAKLVTFHPMVHEITCRQTLFGLILVD